MKGESYIFVVIAECVELELMLSIMCLRLPSHAHLPESKPHYTLWSWLRKVNGPVIQLCLNS